MRVAVTGATGLVGANLVAALDEAGHRVRATRRSTSDVSALAELRVAWVEADLADAAALAAAFEGAEVVFHCAAAVTVKRRVDPGIHDANVVGTGNVIEASGLRAAAARGGARRRIRLVPRRGNGGAAAELSVTGGREAAA
jgi:nucleoside-diphosphate-sugar epimerase